MPLIVVIEGGASAPLQFHIARAPRPVRRANSWRHQRILYRLSYHSLENLGTSPSKSNRSLHRQFILPRVPSVGSMRPEDFYRQLALGAWNSLQQGKYINEANGGMNLPTASCLWASDMRFNYHRIRCDAMIQQAVHQCSVLKINVKRDH
ncbi:hypothetical protein LOAG_02714 [Loa loa]|uniref:Uncharacterized protein n=1 Tax=Loa loa TaxID=7209 RepID=A0A1S0U5V5_LOALO|nr:hypothetical protein LOAG_02714 [Loa loa]EFO25778.2 hypothetical protein LOAG_02714 [Loa loa]